MVVSSLAATSLPVQLTFSCNLPSVLSTVHTAATSKRDAHRTANYPDAVHTTFCRLSPSLLTTPDYRCLARTASPPQPTCRALPAADLKKRHGRRGRNWDKVRVPRAGRRDPFIPALPAPLFAFLYQHVGMRTTGVVADTRRAATRTPHGTAPAHLTRARATTTRTRAHHIYADVLPPVPVCALRFAASRHRCSPPPYLARSRFLSLNLCITFPFNVCLRVCVATVWFLPPAGVRCPCCDGAVGATLLVATYYRTPATCTAGATLPPMRPPVSGSGYTCA